MIHFLSYLKKKERKCMHIFTQRFEWIFFYNVLIEHALLKILKIPLVQGIEYFSLGKNFKMKSMVKIIGPFFKMWSLYIEYHNSLKKKILIFGRLTDSHCYIGTCIRNKSISFKITSWHDTATALYFQGFFKGNLSSCLKKARRPNLSRSPLILFICIIAPKNEKKNVLVAMLPSYRLYKIQSHDAFLQFILVRGKANTNISISLIKYKYTYSL